MASGPARLFLAEIRPPALPKNELPMIRPSGISGGKYPFGLDDKTIGPSAGWIKLPAIRQPCCPWSGCPFFQ